MSIIIVNYNGKINLGNLWKTCLESILDTQYSQFETIFVDNCSTDESYDLAKQFSATHPRLRVIRTPANLGYAGAVNYAVNFVSKPSKYLAILNNDLQVDRAWLSEIVSVMENDSSIGIAQPSIVGLNRKVWTGSFMDWLGFSYLKVDDCDSVLNMSNSEIFCAGGAAMIARRDIYDFAGRLDADFFLYNEEVDVSWRIWIVGKKVVFVPKSIVYHIGSAATKKLSSMTKQVQTVRNQYCTILKNYEFTYLVFCLPALFLIDSAAFLRDMVKRQPSWWTRIKAYTWLYANLATIIKKRLDIQAKRRMTTNEMVHEGLIISPRLIKRIKKNYSF